ncbi:SNAPIN protein homolog [Folsomia candida]|uniref:SNAPIN protein homolog n=1 Tax=Folsomia candida TaxID=158441 RepID=UPI000B8EF32E|nr:SNAPIN protein homolog [Folsomia candida]
MATATSTSDDEQQLNRRSPSEKSQPSLDEDDLTSPNPTRDALAEGIVSLLSPTLKTLDQGVLATKRSQEELSEQIALLTDQLKVISAEQVCPIDLDGYVTRLGTIKGKINVISSVLHAAQERLNKVHEQAVKEASRRKPLLEPSPVASSSASALSSVIDSSQKQHNFPETGKEPEPEENTTDS